MSKPPDNVVNLSDTLSLCEYKSGGNLGFWLYDKTRGMNLSMRANTATDAFVEALTYYQKRMAAVEADHANLRTKVDSFVAQFVVNKATNN